jgi:hypothetical protein
MRRAVTSSIACAAACAACSGDAQFSARYASDFAPAARHTTSVLGLFKDGRLDAEAWDVFGPKLSASLAKGSCPIVYDAALVAQSAPLASAVDDYTRSYGVTDDVLAQIAPMAAGETILVFQISGRPPSHTSTMTSDMPGASTGPMTSRRGAFGGGPRGYGPSSSPGHSAVDTNAYELTASLFSVREHKSVALLAMSYTGSSTDDALRRFVDKLRESLPATACIGWNRDVKVDDQHIRQLPEP